MRAKVAYACSDVTCPIIQQTWRSNTRRRRATAQRSPSARCVRVRSSLLARARQLARDASPLMLTSSAVLLTGNSGPVSGAAFGAPGGGHGPVARDGALAGCGQRAGVYFSTVVELLLCLLPYACLACSLARRILQQLTLAYPPWVTTADAAGGSLGADGESAGAVAFVCDGSASHFRPDARQQLLGAEGECACTCMCLVWGRRAWTMRPACARCSPTF